MTRGRVLIAGFALGALAAFAVVVAFGWSGAFHRQSVTAFNAGQSTAGAATGSPSVSPPVFPAPAATPSGNPLVPVERAGAVMAYDPENHGIIMFGGATYTPTADGSNSASLGDTWLWNGTAWSQLNVTGPSPRSASVGAYDSARHVIVLFGGSGPGGVGPAKLFNDTWIWDGASWTQLTPAHSPSPRFDSAMAYDQRLEQTVLYGGLGQTETFDETWTWDGSDWTRQNPATTPGPRHFFSMAYDADTGVTVLFGGSLPGQRLNDTWLWDGSTWTQPAVPSPAASGWSFLAYDSTRKQVVAYIYFAQDGYPLREYTITWNGNQWTDQSGASDPSPRSGLSLAFDPETGQAVMYGPASGPETWIWDGSSWVLHS